MPLAALPSAAPKARRVLRQVLREWQLERISDLAELVVSELVTNAVQASGNGACTDDQNRQMIALALQLNDASLLIEVWDASNALPVMQEADITSARGRGLLLVDFLADAWGHRAADGGNVIWCEVAIPGQVQQRQAGRAQAPTVPIEVTSITLTGRSLKSDEAHLRAAAEMRT